jgi:hypothetical protein
LAQQTERYIAACPRLLVKFFSNLLLIGRLSWILISAYTTLIKNYPFLTKPSGLLAAGCKAQRAISNLATFIVRSNYCMFEQYQLNQNNTVYTTSILANSKIPLEKLHRQLTQQ